MIRTCFDRVPLQGTGAKRTKAVEEGKGSGRFYIRNPCTPSPLHPPLICIAPTCGFCMDKTEIRCENFHILTAICQPCLTYFFLSFLLGILKVNIVISIFFQHDQFLSSLHLDPSLPAAGRSEGPEQKYSHVYPRSVKSK